MSEDRIMFAEAVQLVGERTFNDWISFERLRELEHALSSEVRPPLRFSDPHIPITAPARSRDQALYDRVREQYDAVAGWLSRHDFGEIESVLKQPRYSQAALNEARQRYSRAALLKALADDPPRTAEKIGKQLKERASDQQLWAYVKEFCDALAATGKRPSQRRLWKKCQDDDFPASRERLFNALDSHLQTKK
jgi:hypothetical protein